MERIVGKGRGRKQWREGSDEETEISSDTPELQGRKMGQRLWICFGGSKGRKGNKRIFLSSCFRYVLICSSSSLRLHMERKRGTRLSHPHDVVSNNGFGSQQNKGWDWSFTFRAKWFSPLNVIWLFVSALRSQQHSELIFLINQLLMGGRWDFQIRK